jgi:hypothetical protein
MSQAAATKPAPTEHALYSQAIARLWRKAT